MNLKGKGVNHMKYYDRVWAEIDLDAIMKNVDHMKANLREGTKMMGIIKTDGYGHGALPIARRMEERDFVFGFGVATAQEAMDLREGGIKKPILILGYTFPDSYADLINAEVRPTLFTDEMLQDFDACSAKAGKKCKVHIKVDTGMSRIGIRPDDEGLAFVQRALTCDNLEVEGIFTHFARADEFDKTSANAQLKRFQDFTNRIESELGVKIPIKHCSNSAGIIEMPEANMDMVRAGITLYGLWPSDEVRKDIVLLQPALSLKSRIVFVKTVEEGCEISYGGTYKATKPTRIATVGIGYGDGYPRGLSNKGYVLIHGQKAPVTGRVCMDQMMIDVSHIKEDVKTGDIVTLIGSEGSESISMEELGELGGRFNYELACDIGKRVPRIYK